MPESSAAATTVDVGSAPVGGSVPRAVAGGVVLVTSVAASTVGRVEAMTVVLGAAVVGTVAGVVVTDAGGDVGVVGTDLSVGVPVVVAGVVVVETGQAGTPP